MKHAAFATLFALAAACPALAQTWVQFDIRGYGPGEYWDLDGYQSGTYGFEASFSVEIDPDSGDFSNWFGTGFYQSDRRYFEEDGQDGASQYSLRASADDGTFGFSYMSCPFDGNVACSSFGGTLTYVPGTFAGGLPDHLPSHPWDSAYGFNLAGHYQNTDGTGRLTFADAHVVDGDSGVYFNGFPSAPPPVPEPATWALTLSGFGLAGGALRYRRRSAVRFA